MIVKVKYPCGFEYSINTGFWAGIRSFDFDDKPCPIHGKDCVVGNWLDTFGGGKK